MKNKQIKTEQKLTGITKIRSRIKLDKWYVWLPIIGSIIYALRVELPITTEVANNSSKETKKLKLIKKYKGFFNLAVILSVIPFITSFFVLRNTGSYGSFPWFFWVAISIGLTVNLTPLPAWCLYKMGLKKYDKSQ